MYVLGFDSLNCSDELTVERFKLLETGVNATFSKKYLSKQNVKNFYK
jgi:hypothetical protein